MCNRSLQVEATPYIIELQSIFNHQSQHPYTYTFNTTETVYQIISKKN